MVKIKIKTFKVCVNENEEFKIKAKDLDEAKEKFINEYVDTHEIDKDGNIID